MNSRINYPINNILVDLEESEVFDLTDEAVKYCVSQYTCKVASEGMERFVQSWRGINTKFKVLITQYCM